MSARVSSARELSDDLAASARLDFGAFLEIAFPIVVPGEQLDYADYIELLIAICDSVARGRQSRVIVNLPPGYLKSTIFSVIYTAWRLGRDPTHQMICISYGDDLAHRLSMLTRRLMESTLYRAIFPGTVLVKKAEDHLVTTKGGRRYATAVFSDITGFRADEIICDDPMQPQDASSAIIKERLRDWMKSSVFTRLNRPDDPFVLIMHRLAPDDLSATLKEDNTDYTVISLPLVAIIDIFYYVKGGRTIYRRCEGDFLNPNRMNAAKVAKLKIEVGPSFESQYQQNPKLLGSGQLTIARLHRYDKAPQPHYVFHSWDIGATVTGNASVLTVWVCAPRRDNQMVFYLDDVVTAQVELPDVRDLIRLHDRIDQPDIILIDHRGVGLGIHQDLRRQGFDHLLSVNEGPNPLEGKMLRFGKAQQAMYDGLAVFPRDAPFMGEVLRNLAAFPDLKSFDLIDSMTQLLVWKDGVLARASCGARKITKQRSPRGWMR